MALLEKIGAGFRLLWCLIFPVFARPRDRRLLGVPLFALLHLILLAGILFGLGWLNRWSGLDKAIAAPTPWLRQAWLPILFLLIYLLSWIGGSILKVLLAGQESQEFHDISAAWEKLVQRLTSANIKITETPLFFVLGRPRAGLIPLFEAARLNLPINEPIGGTPPLLHLAAGKDGIYVCADQCSLLGFQAFLLANQPAPNLMSDTAMAGGAGITAGGGATIGLPRMPGGRRPLFVGSESVLSDTLAGRKTTEVQDSARVKALLDQQESARVRARLAFLCSLILRERRPYVPVNGVLVIVPLASTETDDDAALAGAFISQDVTTVRHALGVTCPAFAIVADLEQAPGFSDFLEGLPSQQRFQRLGQRFPLQPDLDADEAPAMIAGGLRSMTDTLVRTLVFDQLQVENKAAMEHFRDSVVGNARRLQFLFDLYFRQHRAVRIITRGILQPTVEGGLWVGGCYFCGTGRQAESEQAFVAGVFRRLPEEQNSVAWTDHATKAELAYRRQASFATATLGLLGILLVLLIYLLFRDGGM